MTPKTTFLNFSRLNCQIPNYKTKILELSKERESKFHIYRFCSKFLNYIPIDYDFENKEKLFQNFADEPLSFLSKG